MAGFDEIIFDGFRKLFDPNVKETKEAAEMLKSIWPELLVEGELGLGSSCEIVENVPAESLEIDLARRSRAVCQ